MQDGFHTSTTDNLPGAAIQETLGVISAFNESVYSPDTLHRQAADTLRELTQKARELGANGLVGVRFLPTQNFLSALPIWVRPVATALSVSGAVRE